MPLPIRLSFLAAFLAAGWVGFCAWPQVSRAEVVLLKSGARVEGEILNPARGKDDLVEVVPFEGLKLTLAPTQVKGVLVQSKVQKDYDAAVAGMADTLEAHLAMAQWCLDAGLSEPRKFHFSQIIKHDPEHEAARAALGYLKTGSTWMTQSDSMRRQGYIFKDGAYRLPQEIEIMDRARQWELDTKAWRKKIKLWFTWLNGKGKGAEEALANIRDIKEEAAAPALAEALADARLPRELRLLCLDVLTRFPPSYYNSTLIRIALDDPDQEMCDKCLEALREQQSQQALLTFVKGLKAKSNEVVNRSAQCLQGLGNPAATVPLIDALVTTHKSIISSGGSPGSIGAGFSGSGDDNGLGSFSMGNKPKEISRDLNNEAVLSALTSLHQGVNFQFNEPQWKAWYIESHTSSDVDLRRGE